MFCLCHSRQQPSAALRWGALRATAGRPCLGTFRAGVYSAHASSLRLRSAGAHFVRRPVGLASARSVLRRGVHHWGSSGMENGPSAARKSCSTSIKNGPPKADKPFNQKTAYPPDIKCQADKLPIQSISAAVAVCPQTLPCP